MQIELQSQPYSGSRQAPVAITSLAILSLIAAGAWFLLPPIPQNPLYHSFADQRTIWGVPNFWNVVSNLPFLVVAAIGLKALRSPRAFTEQWERTAYIAVLAGAILIAFGSGYYHLRPSSSTLFWDRLPMTLVFMSLLATTIGERISLTLGRICFLPLITLGALSVWYWRVSGDLRLYGIVQFYPMIAIPLLLVLAPPLYTAASGVFATIGLYGLANLLEQLDHPLAASISTGGHPWKHVASAAALLCYTLTVARRQAVQSVGL
jgi:hypothetical protein